MIIGGLIGDTLQSGFSRDGGFFGAIAGAAAFICARLWATERSRDRWSWLAQFEAHSWCLSLSARRASRWAASGCLGYSLPPPIMMASLTLAATRPTQEESSPQTRWGAQQNRRQPGEIRPTLRFVAKFDDVWTTVSSALRRLVRI
jgi:hypothetical protein